MLSRMFARLQSKADVGKDIAQSKPPSTTRIIFATDIHASNSCFNLFLRAGVSFKADVLIIGGDVTGKRLVPIVFNQSAGTYSVKYKGENVRLATRNEAECFALSVANDGNYGLVCDEETFSRLTTDQRYYNSCFTALIEKRLTEWASIADERLRNYDCRFFFNAGNDDIFSIDPIIDQSEVMIRPEGKVVELDEHLSMISTGFANQTPFNCPRDIPEETLKGKIEEMASSISDFSRCIFNFHCPPHGTVLDRAPKLDETLRPVMTGFGVEECSVGSTAVRDTIIKYQPCLSLHGHIHESPGTTKLGRTLCINPGSEYSEHVLRAVILDFQKGDLVTTSPNIMCLAAGS
jgi:uncharacterized protein